MTTDDICIEKDGPIGSVILNRPDKWNAMSLDMWRRLPELLSEMDADPEIRVIILRSSADKAFSAGADIGVFRQIAKDPVAREEYRLAIRDGQRALARTEKPTIAMIQGACIGAGCGLAIHCDLRFAAEDSRFGITPARMGIIYPLNDTRQLIDLVGPAEARKMLFTGKLIGTEEALRVGLIDDVWSADELEPQTVLFAQQMSEASQYSIRHIKKTIRRILDGQIDDDETTAAWFNEAHEGEDFQEGVSAFFDKRKPDFRWNGD